jgi:DNA-binding NarL/FixJ family response regulator
VTSGTTCLVADDHPVVLEAVTARLERHGVTVVATARDGNEALEQIQALHPTIALVDARMPGVDGVEIARRVRESALDSAVVLYTGFGDRQLLLEALEAGARGVVVKGAQLQELVAAVDTVAGGGTYVDPSLGSALANAFLDRDTAAARTQPLTARELDVLRLIADGLSNQEVGERLVLSAETVRTHLRKAMAKLGAETRAQAVAEAIRRGLIS